MAQRITARMQTRTILVLGSLLAFLAVAAGAFGAHVLPEQNKQVFKTGAEYQMYHALGLVLCGLLAARGYRLNIAVWAFLFGVILFSGSLYLLVLAKSTWLGAITPIGGVLLLVGWLALALRAWQGPKPPAQDTGCSQNTGSPQEPAASL
jgi:uncharacterized membrane protein YgdD (TMEM256/DUF423 family)